MMRKNKRGQEEMMGFVLIIVMVIIMGLIFFVFSMRQSGQGAGKESGEMDDMLSSMLHYTTDCSIYGTNQSVNDLIKDCYTKQNSCNGIEDSCTFLNTTLSEMLDQFLGNATTTLANMPIHAYNMSFSQQVAPILGPITNGNQTGSSFVTSGTVFLGRGQKPVEVRLKCWYTKNK